MQCVRGCKLHGRSTEGQGGERPAGSPKGGGVQNSLAGVRLAELGIGESVQPAISIPQGRFGGGERIRPPMLARIRALASEPGWAFGRPLRISGCVPRAFHRPSGFVHGEAGTLTPKMEEEGEDGEKKKKEKKKGTALGEWKANLRKSTQDVFPENELQRVKWGWVAAQFVLNGAAFGLFLGFVFVARIGAMFSLFAYLSTLIMGTVVGEAIGVRVGWVRLGDLFSRGL